MRLVVELTDEQHRLFHLLARARNSTASDLVRSFVIGAISAREFKKEKQGDRNKPN